MPYHIGDKGSNGCSGYPVVSDAGHVAGCHPTEANAKEQLGALYANVADANKGEASIETSTTQENPSSSINSSVGMKKPQIGYSFGRQIGGGIHDKRVVDIWTIKSDSEIATNPIMPTPTYEHCECETCLEQNIQCSNCPDCQNGTDAETQMAMYDAQIGKADPCWEGYTKRGMKPGDNGRMVPNCIPVTKMDAPIVEGDFVIAMTTEGPVVGQVEHVMIEGGTYGQPGNPYSVESTPDNPAVAVRMLEEEDGTYYYTPYSIGALMSDISRINMPNISLEDYEDTEKMSKAEGYSPPAGARSAARRAIKFKEDGKANGAGTAVGWTRAGQLARGESLSLSTVKRMYSYFSRHEVDKKGKDWGNTANPSNGYIMWLAWGGDSGFSWSRSIVNREKDKALFADFGKDYTKHTSERYFI